MQNQESVAAHVAFGELVINVKCCYVTYGLAHHVPFGADDNLNDDHEQKADYLVDLRDASTKSNSNK